MDGQRPIIRSDGTLIRDYFYVKDGVDAISDGREASRRGGPRRGVQFQQRGPDDRARTRRAHLRIARERADPRANDLKQSAGTRSRIKYLSAEKARTELGWAPRHTLREGMAEADRLVQGLPVTIPITEN